MSIEAALRFVFGAVGRKATDYNLSHFRINAGFATSFDGILSMRAPIDVDINVQPHARTMINALSACKNDETIALYMTPAGRLAIKSGKFRAYIDCLPDDLPMLHPQPEGRLFTLPSMLLESFEKLAPLMATDASRPWAQGLRLFGNTTCITNNIVLAEYWHGAQFPLDIIVPDTAINELLRLKLEPTAAQVTNQSATFHFAGDRWLRTNLRDGQWPTELISKLLETGGKPTSIPPGFFEALHKIKPFADSHVIYVEPNRIATAIAANEGASVDIDIPGGRGCFNIQYLLLLEGIAESIDWSGYPGPCYFLGKKIRGCIMGRQQ